MMKVRLLNRNLKQIQLYNTIVRYRTRSHISYFAYILYNTTFTTLARTYLGMRYYF